MKSEDAIELAAHIMGGLLFCDHCERGSDNEYIEYLATKPDADYNDKEFGIWLLARGWNITSQEYDHEEVLGDGKIPLIFESYACLPSSLSWSFSLACPDCSK